MNRSFNDAFVQALQDFDKTKLRQGEVVQKFLPQIIDIAKNVGVVFGDGLQWADVLSLAKLIKPFMLLVKDVKELSGEDKKEFVKESFWLAYKTYDEGPSGKKNNINIPYLPDFIEKKVETFLIPLAVDFAVEALYGVLKEKGDI